MELPKIEALPQRLVTPQRFAGPILRRLVIFPTQAEGQPLGSNVGASETDSRRSAIYYFPGHQDEPEQ